ncbi:MAG: tetratricopeptide repeat protein [Deltaproteobacteria bacterium]|nr:tetratricopeptide repeat protein [Deltaproteobacteria bacterium]
MKTHARTVTMLLGLAGAVVLAAGCAARKPPPVRFDPLHIEVDPAGELPPRFWDSYSLMQDAGRAFEQKKFEQALALYRKVAESDPASDAVPTALFNAGLCLEKLGRYDEAYDAFVALEKRRGPTIELGEVPRAPGGLPRSRGAVGRSRARGRANLRNVQRHPLERINAAIRAGVALYRAGRADAAKTALKNGLREYRSFAEKQLPSTPISRDRVTSTLVKFTSTGTWRWS